MPAHLQVAEAIRLAYNKELTITQADLEAFSCKFPDLEGELLIQRAAAYFWGHWLIRGLGKEEESDHG